uniref:GH39 family glycosyl hydrolase n=1 Tax=Treponema sp. TaxID=166 RepID=UPI00298EA24E
MENQVAMPLKLEIIENNEFQNHWNKSPEFLFVLEGNVSLVLNGKSYELNSEDILYINKDSEYQINGNNFYIIRMYVYTDILPFSDFITNATFNLNSSQFTNQKKYDYVRYLFANAVYSIVKGTTLYQTLSILFSIFHTLSTNFLIIPDSSTSINDNKKNKFQNILSYIEKNFDKCLTLQDVADANALSVPYLSSLFIKITGQTFLSIYNEIRLLHALEDMTKNKLTLEDIALKNGFSEYRSFVLAFKKKYGQTPSKYKNQFLINTKKQPKITKITLQQLNLFPSLQKYLKLYQNNFSQAISDFPLQNDAFAKTINAGSISYNSKGIKLKHNFHKLLCIGSANELLYADIQELIKLVQDEIHYEYINFHGIFSDAMMVYTEEEGKPSYSFVLIDKILDFLQSINLKPFIHFSFMPKALAKNPGKTIDFDHFNVSPPKSLKKWTDLVDAFMNHIIEVYSFEEIQSWKFSIWNEPDGTISDFYWQTEEEFLDFYKATYNTVKSISPDLCFGSPSLLASLRDESTWLQNYFTFCKNNECIPDFINIHYYDNTIPAERGTSVLSIDKSTHSVLPLNSDPYSFNKFLNITFDTLKNYNLHNLPVYMTEWNLTASHRDYLNDTCFKSCYITKNLLENYDRLEAFGYWCLTDFIEESQIPE